MPISRVRRVTPCAVTTARPATAMTSASALSAQEDRPAEAQRLQFEFEHVVERERVDIRQIAARRLRLAAQARQHGARVARRADQNACDRS